MVEFAFLIPIFSIMLMFIKLIAKAEGRMKERVN